MPRSHRSNRRAVPRWPALLAIASLLLAGCGALPAPRAQPIALTVSAAADLTYALADVGAAFEKATGNKVDFNFGSTGQLAQQIEHGAPVDVFAAANVSYVDDLETMGLILPGTKQLYGRGRITLWARADSPLRIATVEDLAQPGIQRIAIANPDHAPYGVVARQAMQAAGVWEAVQPKLVLGENVRQALQYAETGNVDVAVVALSLSVPAASQGGAPGRYTLIPEELHPPIDQALAVLKDTSHPSEAQAFVAFVNGPEGRPIMRKYGFILPGEEPVR